MLGYDRRGHCPMFDGRGCSIYERRPRACRVYDCRVFAATGLMVGDERPVIARRAASFGFDLSGPNDRAELAAVRAAAGFLVDHAAAFPAGFVPENPTQQAVVALKVYDVFLVATNGPRTGDGAAADPESTAALVAATVAACARFETGDPAP